MNEKENLGGKQTQESISPQFLSPQVPIGTVMMYAGMIQIVADKFDDAFLAREGWLICDGRSLPKNSVSYRELEAILAGAYGETEDGKRFFIPDCRGMFVRGVNQGHINDPDAKSRKAQNPGGNTGDNVGTIQEDEIKRHGHTIATVAPIAAKKNPGKNRPAIRVPGNTHPKWKSSMDGGNESRPVNLALFYIIKFA